MSRAFVREDDGTRPEALPETPVSAAPNLVTPRGLRLIEAEIARLDAALDAVEGATPEEGEPEGDEQAARIRRDLRYWNLRHATARLTHPAPETAGAQFGGRVTYETEDGERKTVIITGEDEADPTSGRIAYTAPVARALIGAEPGSSVTLSLGDRRVELEVVAVDIPPDDDAEG
jgi:transcription elongation GreA/GreB family factor